MRLAALILCVVFAFGTPANAQSGSVTDPLNTGAMLKDLCSQSRTLCDLEAAGTLYGLAVGSANAISALRPPQQTEPLTDTQIFAQGLRLCPVGKPDWYALGDMLVAYLDTHPEAAIQKRIEVAYHAMSIYLACADDRPTAPATERVPFEDRNAAIAQVCRDDPSMCSELVRILDTSITTGAAMALKNFGVLLDPNGKPRPEIIAKMPLIKGYCPPAGASGTATVRQFLTNHPERSDVFVFENTLLALKDAFPCQ